MKWTGPACLLALVGATVADARIPSSPNLGVAEGRCRPGERGPAFLVHLVGLKDRAGLVKVELFPANDRDWLADDDKLVNAGKPFRRVRERVPQAGPVVVCIRAPGPGTWALAVLHDRDGSGKFALSKDGVGFPANPHSLGPTKPGVALGRAAVGNGPGSLTIRMLYRSGLFSFAPLGR